MGDFASWIYSLYLGSASEEQLSNGKKVERAVCELGGVSTKSQWELIYRDSLGEDGTLPKKISSVRDSGIDLWRKPDLVFRNDITGCVLIVERKATNYRIPSDGWPNLRAQLWAYSQIDDWADAPSILMAGEIWGFDGERVFRRSSIVWNTSDAIFVSQSQALFDIYVGRAHDVSILPFLSALLASSTTRRLTPNATVA